MLTPTQGAEPDALFRSDGFRDGRWSDLERRGLVVREAPPVEIENWLFVRAHTEPAGDNARRPVARARRKPGGAPRRSALSVMASAVYI
jgi:hypothetical protein